MANFDLDPFIPPLLPLIVVLTRAIAPLQPDPRGKQLGRVEMALQVSHHLG
jgi:hypothetical protein